MKANILKKIIIAAVVIYLPVQAAAWGTQGHRISGQIADAYLTPKARKAIKAILGDESVAMSSTWADFIKSDPNYSYLSPWHYVDFDQPMAYPQMVDFLKTDKNVDAYTKLQFMLGEMKNKTITAENKLLYLRMIIHIVEDIHQPMHTARSSDKGGNNVKVKWFSEDSNLHSVWDSKLIDFQQLSYTEYTAWINHSSAAQRIAWQKEPISKWIFDSSQIAEKIYAETKPDEVLGYKYNFKFINTVNSQLVKAGVHLAGLLNQIFR